MSAPTSTAPQMLHPETQVLHVGWRSDATTGSVAVPIHQTTSYLFNSTEHAANLFGLREFGNIYTRIMNPTNDVLEKRVAALEGGVAALAVSSGQAASAFALQNVARAGDNVIASTDLYGGTVNLFKNTLRDQGIEVRFVDPLDPENFERAIDDKTRAFYGEALPNPYLRPFPVKEVADIGRRYGIPLIIDNTAAPIISKPLEHGAAIVIHSLTKYIGGHGSSIGGIIVDGGNFPWTEWKERQPFYNTPDPSYGGAVWGDVVPVLTGANIPFIIRARVVLLRDLGSAISPFNSWQIIQGIETLPLRIRQHNANAIAVRDYLLAHPKVERVIHPGLYDGEIGRRTNYYLKGGQGALLGLELKGGIEDGKKFINSLKLLYHVANIGDARSLAIHPASTTHSQLSPEDLAKAGVTPGYVRLSIGLEHHEDIIADIDQALAAI